MAKKILPFKKLADIKKVFENQNDEKSKMALSLLDEAFFVGQTLEDLKNEVRKTGVITEMCQGSYEITRENPALKSYNVTLKSYQNLIKQIVELLNGTSSSEDELEEFIK